MEHQWEVENFDRQAAHDIKINQMKLEGTKLEITLRNENATEARLHQQQMKELELEIRKTEANWQQVFRLPVLIIKLPLYLLFGVAFIVATWKGAEINQGDYWKLLR